MIIIASFYDDAHASAVEWSLTQCGVACHLLDTMSLSSSAALTLEPAPSGGWNIALDNAGASSSIRFNTSEVSAVWSRRLNTRFFDLTRVHQLDRPAVTAECRALVANLHATLNETKAYKINDSNASHAAADKALQICHAKNCGLKTPRTLMSNDPEAVRCFADAVDGPLLFKPFYQAVWQEDGKESIQHAQKLDAQHLAMDGAISLCPGIYQEYVEKAYELRVVIMGDDILAAKINSQDVKEAATDWRSDFLNKATIEPYECLPDQVKNALLKFMRSMNLDFGSIDMVVTPLGEYVFLEVNDQGQFLWIEQRNSDIQLLARFTAYLAHSGGHTLRVDPPNLSDYFASVENASRREFVRARWATCQASPVSQAAA